DNLRHEVQHLAQSVFTAAKLFLHHPLVVDIRARTDPLRDIPLLVLHRIRPGEEPLVFAIPSSQGRSQFPLLGALPGVDDKRLGLRYMVGVVYRHPPPTFDNVGIRSRIIIPALVIPVHPAIRTRHPGEVLNAIAEIAELLFTFLERFFRLYPFRYLKNRGADVLHRRTAFDDDRIERREPGPYSIGIRRNGSTDLYIPSSLARAKDVRENVLQVAKRFRENISDMLANVFVWRRTVHPC